METERIGLAKGASDVPLVPISTGTNNVFPVMVEATVAGLAAGAIASGSVDASEATRRCKWIEIELDGGRKDLALIDAVAMDGRFVGARAIWNVEDVREVVLTRAQPDAIGMSAVGGMVTSVTAEDDCGLHLEIGEGEACRRGRHRTGAGPPGPAGERPTPALW